MQFSLKYTAAMAFVAATAIVAGFAGDRMLDHQAAASGCQEIDGPVLAKALKNHPEALYEGLVSLHDWQQDVGRHKTLETIRAHATELFAPGFAPAAGSPDAKNVIVEFFDYQCGFCRRANPVLERTLAANPDVKVIYRDLPIEGPASILAAKAAVAAGFQGRYVPMHDALFQQPMPLTPEKILAAATDAGVDVKKMQEDMNADLQSPDHTSPVVEILKANMEAAHLKDIEVDATPSFIGYHTGIMKGFAGEKAFLDFAKSAGKP